MTCLLSLDHRMRLLLSTVVAAFMVLAPPAHAAEAAIWQALREGGHVVLMRHAIAPGTGDPANFALGDCATQRNLSAEGRAQAARIGARFRENGITSADVYASEWCRAHDTAKLLVLGSVSPLPALNSFFGRADRENAQTRALRDWLSKQNLERPLVLVTHQVNITALTGVYPASGEVVVIRRGSAGRYPVMGTLRTD